MQEGHGILHLALGVAQVVGVGSVVFLERVAVEQALLRDYCPGALVPRPFDTVPADDVFEDVQGAVVDVTALAPVSLGGCWRAPKHRMATPYGAGVRPGEPQPVDGAASFCREEGVSFYASPRV